MRSTGLGRVSDGATDTSLGLLVYRIDATGWNDWEWDGMGWDGTGWDGMNDA